MAEREKLQALAAPYRGRSLRSLSGMKFRKDVMGYQHPLSVYQELMAGGLA